MIRNFSIFVLAGVLLTSCKSESPEQKLKVAAVKAFYQTILTFKEGGIPTGSNLKRLTPLISKGFLKHLQAAQEAEERDFKRSKGEEPPLVEGSLFYSLFEGADRMKGIRADPKAGPNAFLVDLEYGDPSDKNQFTKWSDRAIVINENGKWVVDDLELLGDWQFGSKGKMSTILNAVATFDKQEPKSK